MKKAVVVLVLFVILAAATGCLGGEVEGIDADISPDTEPVETNATGNEILASAVETTEDVEPYSVDSQHRFVAGASGLFDMNFTMDSTGSFDTEDRRILVETDGTADFSFLVLGNTTEFETFVYSDEGSMWRRSVEDGEVTGWSEREGNFTYAESVLGVGAVNETYGDFGAELLGGETINGVDTYVVSVNASAERLSRHSSAVIGLHGEGIEEREEEAAPENEIEAGVEEEPNVEAVKEAYLWVERDTRRPVRMAHRISIGSSENDTAVSESGNGTSGGSGGEDGEGSDAGGVDFLFVADWSYGDGDVEPPEGLSSSEGEGT